MKERRRKVCIVFHDADKYNGATHSMLDLIKTWNRLNEFAFVCVLPAKGSAVNELSSMGIKTIIHPYHSARYFTTDCYVLIKIKHIIKLFRLCTDRMFVARKIIKELKKENIDFVYSNTGSIYMGAWISSELAIHHVWHIREMGEEDQNAKMLFGERYFSKLLNKSSLIIVISNTVKNKYRRFLSDTSKIHRVYNDVMIRQQPFFERKISKVFNVIIIGSLIEGKRQEDVIRAVSGCISDIPNINLYIAGKNMGKYYDKLTSLVENLGLGDRVHFLGQVRNLNEVTAKMHVQVVASRCEAFGRITIEAFAYGLPLIGANTGCTAELVSDHSTGLLYQYGNIEDLQKKIKYSYQNYSDMILMARTASDYCKQFMEGNAAKEISLLISNM